MSARKRRLVLGCVLIDVAAIAIAVWQITALSPEPRRAGRIEGNPGLNQFPNAGVRPPGFPISAINALSPTMGFESMGDAPMIVGAPPLAMFTPIMQNPGPFFAFSKLALRSQAPDFALPRVGEGPLVRLGALRAQKPVVLIFSSFTCDVFCDRLADLESFYQRYRDRTEFLLVVVKEANHSIPGLEFLLKAENPTPVQRRRLLARALELKKVTIPTVMDDENRTVEKTYFGWPYRVVVVDADGKIDLDLPFWARPQGGPDLERLQMWLKDHFG
jgi:hypothetical protein